MLDLVNTRKNVLGKAAKRDIDKLIIVFHNKLRKEIQILQTKSSFSLSNSFFPLLSNRESGLNTHIQDTLPIGLTLTNDDI